MFAFIDEDPVQEKELKPRRIAGRIWVSLQLLTIGGTFFFIVADEALQATVLLLATFFMNFYTSFQLKHQDIERPLALFWLGLTEKFLVNILFITVFWKLLMNVDRPFPTLLCTGLIILTVRNLAYLVFSIVLLKEKRYLPMNSFWGKTTTLALNLTLISYIWDIEHFSRILIVVALMLMLCTSVGYLYFYYRDEQARKPVSVATQLTLSRIVLSPVFIWVFFYDNDLVYQNNHLVFKILALILAVFLVVSDGLDGYLARKMGEVTTLGKFLDPFSDKISNMSIFLCFLASGFANVWMVALIYFRESTVETLRTLGAAEGVIIDARKSGKWKTALQGTVMITILSFGLFDALFQRHGVIPGWWNPIWEYGPHGLMYFVTAFTMLSGIDYFVANRKVLKKYF